MIGRITLAEREAILSWLRRHPASSIDEIAASGLYKATRAVTQPNAARCWARHHMAAMRAQGKVFVVKGTGHRGDARRFSVTCRHPFTDRVHMGNTAACLKCGLQEDVHR